MDMTEFLQFDDGECVFDAAPAAQALTLSAPLDTIFAQYRKDKADIERIAAYVAGETAVMHYFMDGAQVEGRCHSLTASALFQADHATRSLDASYWSRAISLTDVLNYMPQDKRQAWNEQIRKHETPPFEPESVKATLHDLLAQRHHFFAERIDGIFRALSGHHITNSPAGFGKRMILTGITTSWYSTERVGYINDLRCVIAKFMGRDEPKWNASSAIVEEARRMHGEWLTLDGGALRIRCYLNGNAHLEVHNDKAWRMDAVLASLYPAAIPPEFRRKPVKPKKAPKDFAMMGRPLPFAVLECLTAMQPGYRLIKQEDNWRNPYRREDIPNSMQFDLTRSALDKTPGAREEAEKVLAYIGGVKAERELWFFEYRPNEVIAETIRTGLLPDQKSHQYYPTPPQLAATVVALAEIGDLDECLEPSAGTGGIADLLPQSRTTCLDISPLHCKVLTAKGFSTVCADFLAWEPGRRWSRIVMNPPFSDGRALAHLEKAASLLSDTGRLVAILPASYKGKTLVPGFEHQWGKTHQGEFSGTSISVIALVLTRR